MARLQDWVRFAVASVRQPGQKMTAEQARAALAVLETHLGPPHGSAAIQQALRTVLPWIAGALEPAAVEILAVRGGSFLGWHFAQQRERFEESLLREGSFDRAQIEPIFNSRLWSGSKRNQYFQDIVARYSERITPAALRWLAAETAKPLPLIEDDVARAAFLAEASQKVQQLRTNEPAGLGPRSVAALWTMLEPLYVPGNDRSERTGWMWLNVPMSAAGRDTFDALLDAQKSP